LGERPYISKENKTTVSDTDVELDCGRAVAEQHKKNLKKERRGRKRRMKKGTKFQAIWSDGPVGEKATNVGGCS